MNDARYEELLARVLDDEVTEPEAAELAEAVGQHRHRARDLRQHLALWELYAQHVAVERSVDAFVASCETRLLAEGDSETFAERVETELLERSQAGAVHPVREPLRSRLRSPAGEWFERWRLGFALAGATAALTAGFLLWQPIEGQPVLNAHSPSGIVVERAGAAVPIIEPFRLRPFDVLTVTGTSPAAITYGSENTHLELHPGARLTLLAWATGKRFQLERGKVEASVARQRWRRPMIVSTPVAEARVLGTRFILLATTNTTQLQVTEGSVRLSEKSTGKSAKVSAGHYAVLPVAQEVELAALPQTGGVLREYWTNVSGVFVRDLEKDRRYPDRPDGRDLLKAFEVPTDWGDNYGLRIRGYVHPPVTGDYTFWTAGNAGFFLFVSPDDDPAGAVCVCYGGNTRPRDFDRPQANEKASKSNPIRMVAGRHYYIEALLKAGVGEDHLSVAWSTPGREREIIPGEFLSPFKPKK